MAALSVRQNALQRFLQFVPGSAIGAAMFSKMLHHLDRPLMRLSNGRLSIPQFVAGLPCVTLTSTGARSGVARTIPTIGIPDGENVALIASNWGQKHHPAWYFNLRQHAQATLRFDGHEGRYIAREIPPGEEYDRLWDKATQVYSGYEKYKTRTGGRAIPILLLEPA
jgi:deazaflavin-dependent oxidoreductase (nitroreductase family)